MRQVVAKRLRKALWKSVLSATSTRQMNADIARFKTDYRRLKKEYNRGRRRTG